MAADRDRGAAFLMIFAWANRPVSIDDGVAEERTRMAERLVTLGRFDEAERWAERAEQRHPHPGVVHFRVAQQLVAHDQTTAAIAHFQKALRLDPGQPVVEYALGETLLEAERPHEAVDLLRHALAAGVHVDQAGYDLVRALGASGDPAGAVRMLRQVRPARDDDAERWVALGQAAIQLREPGLAETFARKALAARADFGAAHAQLGAAFNLQGRWNDAARELAEAVRLDPRDPTPHIGLAVAEAGAGRMANAHLHVDEALRLDPRSEPAKRVQEALDRAPGRRGERNRN
jgi:predicted Zn-dependent protease